MSHNPKDSSYESKLAHLKTQYLTADELNRLNEACSIPTNQIRPDDPYGINVDRLSIKYSDNCPDDRGIYPSPTQLRKIPDIEDKDNWLD